MPIRKYADIEALVRKTGLSPTKAARQLDYTGEFQFRTNKADGAVKPRYRNTDAKRNERSKKQTVGGPDFNDAPISNTQKHHLRMLSLYAPLFEGLSDSDAEELAQFAVEIGLPLGDVLANRGDLPQPEHSELHNYQRKHGLTGQHIPSFKNATLGNRKKALRVFFKDFIQPDIDAKTMSLMQKYQANNPEQYTQTYSDQLNQPDDSPELLNLNALAQRMREPQTYLRGAMEVAAFMTDSSPLGQATDMAVQGFDALVDEPVRQATGKGIFEHIPNGSIEERRSENKKLSSDLKKNNGHNGNGSAHFITNELNYIARKIADGKLPYNGH